MKTKIILFVCYVLSFTAFAMGQDSIKFIGFRRHHATSAEEKKHLLKVADEMKKTQSSLAGNIYIAEDGSCQTMYMPLLDVVIDYEGKRFIANDKGALATSEIIDFSKIKVLGRKKSEFAQGTSNDLITDDLILFKKELSPDIAGEHLYSETGYKIVYVDLNQLQ
jgi:hypothetical protein